MRHPVIDPYLCMWADEWKLFCQILKSTFEHRPGWSISVGPICRDLYSKFYNSYLNFSQKWKRYKYDNLKNLDQLWRGPRKRNLYLLVLNASTIQLFYRSCRVILISKLDGKKSLKFLAFFIWVFTLTKPKPSDTRLSLFLHSFTCSISPHVENNSFNLVFRNSIIFTVVLIEQKKINEKN